MIKTAADCLNVKQAAQALQTTVYSIRLWVHDRKLSAFKIGGRLYFSPEDIAAFLARNRIEARGQRPAKRIKEKEAK